MLYSKIEGGGESGREQLISQFKHCGQAADKNKQTKRMVGHTEQTKKETISKQTKAKRERTDHNYHENWSTLYLIVERMKQRK